MAEEAKIGMLFDKTNYPELTQAIVAIGMQCNVNKMTFFQITNNLSTKVSKFDNKQAKFRVVATVKLGKPKHNGKGPSNGGVCMPDGSVFTVFYPN